MTNAEKRQKLAAHVAAYGKAAQTGDQILVNFAASAIEQLMGEFLPDEPAPAPPDKENDK